MLNKGLFLDRDGVINENKGYVNSPKSLKFIEGTIDFAKRAYDAGYKLFIVTNQGGIALGYISMLDHGYIMQAVLKKFEERGCPIEAYYSCVHVPPNHPAVQTSPNKLPDLVKYCDCRKPKPGMILDAARHYDIDLAQSIMIGDMQTDIDAAVAAGIGTPFLFNQEDAQWPTL